MTRHGLFVGLLTLDLIYLTAKLPRPNQKQVALDYTLAAGGPATNSAVTFRYLGDRSTLLSAAGTHPMTHFALAELHQQQVKLVDLNPTHVDPIATSSILVTQGTGERAVISLNAVKVQATLDRLPPDLLKDVEIVLVDGHQMQVGQAIAAQARSQEIPVVVDGGSWKPGFDAVLSHTDYAICSEDFLPPNCQNSTETIAYLKTLGIPQIAITHGAKPIQFYTGDAMGTVTVPAVEVIDTVGAGDIFHGAFCHFILRSPFPQALAEAAAVAARSCRFLGTRHWMTADLGDTV